MPGCATTSNHLERKEEGKEDETEGEDPQLFLFRFGFGFLRQDFSVSQL